MDFNNPSNPISPMNPASPFYVGNAPPTYDSSSAEYHTNYKPADPVDPFTSMLVILALGAFAVGYVFFRVK